MAESYIPVHAEECRKFLAMQGEILAMRRGMDGRSCGAYGVAAGPCPRWQLSHTHTHTQVVRLRLHTLPISRQLAHQKRPPFILCSRTARIEARKLSYSDAPPPATDATGAVL
eukprot:8228-Chlamydomonas_euryale.AAC.4